MLFTVNLRVSTSVAFGPKVSSPARDQGQAGERRGAALAAQASVVVVAVEAVDTAASVAAH